METNREEFYGRIATDLPLDNRAETVLRYLERFEFRRFLDIGCGNGDVTRLIARAVKATEIKGIEITGIGSRLAREKGIDCVQFDTDRDTKLPFSENYFDFVFCGEVIEHVFDPDKLLASAYAMLKPGGTIIITTPNLAAWHNRITLLLGYNPLWCSVSFKHHSAGKLLRLRNGVGLDHIRFFTLGALRELFILQGFVVQKVFGFYPLIEGNIPRHVQYPLRMVERLFSLFPGLATQIGIVGIKPGHSLPAEK
jgi:SAM-dependent methyltransferase